MYDNRSDNPYWSGYHQYRTENENPYPGGGAPQLPSGSPEPPRRKKRSRRGGYVALLLAVSMVSGVAGGGFSYMLFRNDLALVETVTEAQAQATETVLPETEGSVYLPSSDDSTTDISEIVSRASVSVVEISTEVRSYNPFFGESVGQGSGSGVIYSEDGYIVTNDHVVESAGTITVRTYDGSEYEAQLVGTDSSTDLAVLKIEATGLSPVTLADSDQVKVGELAVAIGNPLGTLGGTVTDGIISATNREITINDTTMTLLQTSAAVNPGNSGGGLFNSRSELVGVVNAKSSGSEIEGLGFAIPSNTVKKVVADLIDYGYVTGRPELGIRIVNITDLRTARYYGQSETGVYVVEVNKDNGLQAWDRIISVNGAEVQEADDFISAVQASVPGDTLTVVLSRDGSQMTVDVTVSEQTPEPAEVLPEESEL